MQELLTLNGLIHLTLFSNEFGPNQLETWVKTRESLLKGKALYG
jgi:hypothetical protein